MQFDSQSAINAFAQKDTQELIRIAFLEDTYVDDAKNVAKDELARRGVTSVTSEELECVRQEIEARKIAKEENDLRSIEMDQHLPSWRRTAKAWATPYRVPITISAVIGIALFGLNSYFEWGLLNLDRNNSKAVALVIGIVWFILLSPTREEFRKMKQTK